MNTQEKTVIEHFNITDTELELLHMLASDLWSGPLYLVDSEENADDTIIVNDKPYHFASWSARGIIGAAFPELIELNSPLMDRLSDPVYYEPDTGCLMDKEPEGYFDQELFNEDYPDGIDSDEEDEIRDGYWIEPMDYFKLDRCDILEQLVGPRTAREIVYHF